MNKRKPPSRGRERGSDRPRDFQQDQRHRPHRHESGRRPDGGDAAPGRGHRQEPRRDRAPDLRQPGGPYWLYGHHAVEAALANPERKILRLAQSDAGELPVVEGHEWEQVSRDILESWLPAGAVHQGLAAKVHPLPDRAIEDVIAEAASRENAQVMILDQVTDPQNVGAILRSAAAFSALAVILTERHAAPESGALAKAASGALEHVPLIRVANLARALELLKKGGFWIAGLAAEGTQTLAEAKLTGKVGLALGAEGPGLRRLTREHCDLLVRLPTSGPIDHLNVSNAAAVALYELVRNGEDRP